MITAKEGKDLENAIRTAREQSRKRAIKLMILMACGILLAGCAPVVKEPTPECDAIAGAIYVGNSPDECSTIRFICEPNMEYFSDACGCGCQPGKQDETRYECTEEQRNVDACPELYMPTCGWFDEGIHCFAYPCAQTFGNSCEACANENVKYWMSGECPSVGG